MFYDFWGRTTVLTSLYGSYHNITLCTLYWELAIAQSLHISPCIKGFIEYMKILLYNTVSAKIVQHSHSPPPHTHKPQIYMTLFKKQ